MNKFALSIICIGLVAFTPKTVMDSTYQTLPFSQNWVSTGLITTDDNWAGVPGVVGFRGDDITTVTGTDPQTLLADGSATPVDVIANQSNPNTQATGGVAEFDGIANPVVALQPSGTADVPHVVIHLNTTGLSNITIAYNLRDIDGSTDNAVQPVALQYRIGGSGSYTNIPAGFVADATTGPSLATLVTPISVLLPAACNNQSQVQLRILTANAVGNDEWVGIDDISVTSAAAGAVVTGKLTDVISIDNYAPGIANPTDEITYKNTIKNTGTVTATGVTLTESTPTNTTLVPGSEVTSALARNDVFTTGFNTALTNGNVITNDYGLPSVSVVSFGTVASLGATTPAGSAGTTTAGGILTVNSNGTFNYSPPLGYSGTDQFKYIATTGVAGLPNNDALVSITINPDLTFATTQTNPLCNGGTTGILTFTMVAGGSGSGYTYSITGAAGTYFASPNFTGLSAGTYNLAVKDGAGYIKTGTATLNDPPLLSFTHVDVNNVCNGGSIGSITFTATGGTGTITYSITGSAGTYQASNVFNALASGVYNLAVKDANGCISTGTATITSPAVVTFTFTKTDITCFGLNNGSIVFNTTSGGTSPYTYSITGIGGTFQASNTFTGLTPGVKSLVAKDVNSCISPVTSSTVLEPAQIVVSGTVPPLTFGVAMSNVTFTKTGGVGTPANPWSVSSGTLPTNLTLNTATGVLSGTPNVTGLFPVTITYTDATGCTGNLSITIDVGANLLAETYTNVGNTQLNGGGTAPVTPHVSVASVAGNDLPGSGVTYALVSGPTHGALTLNADGTFLYTPALNNITVTTFVYSGTINGTVRQQTATVNFSGKVWYVQGGAAAGDGRSHTPLNTLPSGNLGGTGDFIYVEKEVSGTTPGSITLQANQHLIGAGATLNVPTAGPILTIAGVAGNTPMLTNTVTLNTGVTVAGIDMTTATNAAIINAGITVTGVNVTARNVTTSTGTGLSISGAGPHNVTMTLTTLTTSGAANAVTLNNTAGTVTINGGALAGGAGATFNVSGGTVSTTYTGGITQATASQPMVNVSGGHASGTIAFNTGTLNATNGTGLQFDNADGTYNFSGTTTLNGGDAGIDILNGSGGTFTFGNNTSITNPSGTGFNLANSNAPVTYSGSISDNTGLAVNIDNHDANTIIFQTGNITGGGISVANCSGGTIHFNNPSINLNTGSATAVNLSTNGGATINFAAAGAGLDINTTSATGFNATGGATAINMTGTGNTIISTTGTALNVVSTTIGSSGLNFLSISSSGGNATGIILDNTGNSGGGFTVTGTGTTAGSGGVIANKSGADGALTTGCGIYLNNTRNISLSNMNFTGPIQNFGIRGFTVDNFTLKTSNFTGQYGTNNSGGVAESTIHFGTVGSDGSGNGLTGTAVFNGNSIGGGYTDNLGIFNNNTGSLNITIADEGAVPAIFEHPVTTGNVSNDAILIETRGNGGAAGAGFNLTFNATGVQFKGARGDNIQTVAASNSTHNITILNNTFHNTHPQIVSGGGGIAVTGAGTNFTVNYNVESNSFRGAKGSPVHIAFGGNTGNARGTVLNNIIGLDDPGRPRASKHQDSTGASDNGNGINMYNDKALGTGVLTHATRIEGNQVRDVTGVPIYIRSNGPGASPSLTRVEATILNNVVEEVWGSTMGGTFSCLYLVASGGGFPDQGKIGANIRNNIFHNDNTIGMDGDHNAITFDQGDLNGYPYLPGYTGGLTDGAAISAFLVNAPNSNTMSNGFMPVGSGFVYANAQVHNEPLVLLPVPLYAAHSPLNNENANSVAQAEVDRLLDAALNRFAKSGISQTDLEKLKKVKVTVSDLPVLFLGDSDNEIIRIDDNGAGFGWYVDQTPDNDEEFENCSYSVDNKMDLLTVIMHELGHHIGWHDDLPDYPEAHLMEGNLLPGERRMLCSHR